MHGGCPIARTRGRLARSHGDLPERQQGLAAGAGRVQQGAFQALQVLAGRLQQGQRVGDVLGPVIQFLRRVICHPDQAEVRDQPAGPSWTTACTAAVARTVSRCWMAGSLRHGPGQSLRG